MGDIFMVILILLMVSYAFWDELFTNYRKTGRHENFHGKKTGRPKPPECSGSFFFCLCSTIT